MLIISLEEWNVSSVVHRNLLELEEIPTEEVMVEEIHTEEDVIPTEEDAIPIVDAVAAEVLVADDSDLVLAVVAVATIMTDVVVIVREIDTILVETTDVVRDLLPETTDVAIVRDLLLEEMTEAVLLPHEEMTEVVTPLLLAESVIRRETDRERDVIRTKKLYLYNLPCLIT